MRSSPARHAGHRPTERFHSESCRPADILSAELRTVDASGTEKLPPPGVATTRPVPTCHPLPIQTAKAHEAAPATEPEFSGLANHTQKPPVKHLIKSP
jgi:hypothetical protein